MISDIFKTPIYETNIKIDNENLITFITTLSETTHGVKRSNIGGWQSDNLIEVSEVFEISKTIKMHSFAFSSLLGLTISNTLSNIWTNINRYKDYNREHIHPGSKLSGVYYIKVPKNSGDIYFINPSAKYCALTFGANYNPLYDTGYAFTNHITPIEGKLIIFPSWVEHGVLPNMNKTETRISLSFNID